MIHPSLEAVQALNEEIPADSQKRLKILAILKEKAAQGGIAREVFLEAEKSRWAVFPGYAAEKETKLFYRDGRVSEGMLLFTKDFLDDLSPAAAAEYVLSEMSGDRLNAGRENANWKNYLAKWLERRLVPEKFTQLLYQLYRIHYKIKLGKYNAHLGEGRDHPEYAADDVLVTQLANQLGLTGAKNNYEVLKLLYRRGVLEAVYTHAMHQAIHALRRDDYAVVREYKTLVEVLANMIYIGASQKEAPGWFARGEAQYNAEVDHKVQGWTDTQKDMALRIQTALGKLNNDPETVPQLKSAHVVLKEFGEFMDYIQSIRNSFNLSEYITGLEEKHSALKLEFENAVNGVLDRWLLLIEEKIEKIEGLIGFIDRLRLDVLRRQVPAQGGVEAIVNFSNARVLLAELDVLRRKSEELGAFLEGENREKITQIIQKTDKARLFYGQKLSTVKGIVGESEKPVSPPVPVPPKGFERQVAPVLPQARASLSQTTSKNSTASHGVSKHVNPSEPTITSREEVTGLVLQSQRMSAQSSQMAKIEAALSEESPQWIPIRGMITQMVELGAQDLDQVSPGFKSRLAAKIFLSLERALENDDPDWPGLDVILRGAAEIGVGDIGGMTPRKHLEYFGEMKKAWVLNRLQTALSEEPVHSKRVTALLEKAAAYGVKDPVINRTKSRISGEPADGARPERGALAPSRGARLSTVKILIADTPVTGARLAHARVAKVAAYTKLPRQTVATRRRFMGRDLRKLGKKHGHFWLEGIRVQGRPRSRLGVGLELYVPHLSNTSGNKRTVYNLPKKYKDRPIDMAVDAFGFPYWIGIKPDRKRPYGFRKFFKRILVRREDGKIKEVLGAALLDVMLADILNAVQLANRLNGDAVVTRLDVKKNMPRSDSRKFTVGRQRIFIEAEDARGLPDRLYGEVIYDKTKKRKPVPRTLLVGVYRSDDPDDPASGELQVLRRFTLVKHPTLPDYYVVRDKELERWKSRLYRHYLSLVRTMSVFQAVSRLLETPGIPEKLKDLNVLGEAFSRLGTRALYLGKHYPLWLETEAVGIADLYGFYLSFGRSKELFRGFLREVIGPGLQLLSVSDEIFYKVVQKSKSPDSRPVSDWVITRLRRNARSKRVEAEAQSSREEKLRQFSEIDPEVFLDTVVRNNLNHWSKVIHVSNRPAVSEIRGLLEPKFRETAKQVFKQAVNEWEPQNSVKLKNYAARKVAVALYDAAKEVKGEIEERLRRLTTKASVDFTSAAVWRQKTGGARLAKQPGEPADGARPERGALAPSRGARLSTVKILIADKPAGDETIDAIRALVSSFGDRVELINTVGIGKDETALKAIIEKEKPAVILIRSATKAFSKEAMLRLAKANGLRAIIRAGAGVDNVDLAKAEKNDIAVIRTHGNANSVANLNLRFLIASLAGSKKIPSDGQDVSESGRFREIFDVSLGEFLEAEEKSEKGRMSKSDREAVLSPLSEHELLRRLKTLKGKTIGLAGFGPVAQAFAGKLEKLREITGVQFRVIATSPSLYNRRSDRMVLAQKLGVEPVFEGEVWTESDILSLHLPAEAAGSADVLGRTAKNPHLKAILNSSRQALLLLPALEKFLSERPDLRYFADVDMDSDLEAFHERFEGRAFISPHIAASTKNAARGVEEKVLTTLEATVRKLLGEPTDFEPTMMNHVLLRAFARMDFNNLQEELRTRNDGDARLEQIAVRSLYHASSSLKGLDSLMNYLMVLGLNLADNNLDHPLVKKIENLADDFRKIRAEVERQFSMTDVSGRPDLQKTLGDLRDRFDGLIPELPVLTESESRKEFKRLWAQIIQVLDDRIELMKGLSGDAGTSAFKDVWQIRGEEDRLKSLEAAVDEEAARQTLPLSRIRLFSVLVNLAANASKHGDGNGHVRLSVGFEGNDRSKVVIKVSNTETERIPPEYFEKTPGARRIRLFELEQRPWGPSSRIPVGLAEVYDTVAIAGGEISIEETGEAGVPGGTVEFTVRIPVMSAEKARSTAERIWKGEEEPVWRKNLTLPVLEQIIFIHAREIREFVSPDERRRRSEKIKGIFDTSVLNAAEKSGKFPDLDFKLLRGYLLAPIESSKQPLAGEAETGDYLLKLAKTASAGPKESRALDQFVKFLAFVTEAWAEAVLLAAQRSENEYDAVYFSDIYIRFLIIEIEGIPVFHELSGEIRDVHSFVDTVFYAFQSLKDRNNQHYDLAHFGNTGTQQSFYANLIFSILLEQPKLNPRLEKVLKTLNPSFPSPNDAEFRFIRLNKSIRRAMAFPGDLVVPAQEAPVQAGARFAHASRSAFRDYVQAIWEMGQYQPKEALALVLWTVPVMLFFPAIVSLLDWRQSVWPKSTALLPSESDEVKTESDEVKIRALEMAFGDLVTKVFNEERRRTKNFTLSLWTSKGKEGSTIYDFSDAGGSETSLAPVYSGFAKRNTLAVSFIPRRPFEASMLDLNSSIPALPLPERLKDLSRVFGRELAHFAREEKIRFVHHLDPSASWPGIVITNWRLGVRRSVEFYLRQLDAPLVRHSVVRSANPSFDPTDLLDILDKAGAEEVRNRLLMIRGELEREPTIQRTPFQTRLIETIDTALSQIPPRTEFLGFESGARLAVGSAKSLSPASPAEGNGQYLPAAGKQRVLLRVDSKHIEATIIDSQGHIVRSVNPIATDDWRKAHEAYRDFVSRMRGDNPKRELKRVRIKLQNHVIHRVAEQLRKLLDDESVDFDSIDAILIESQGSFSSTGKLENDLDALSLMRETDFLGKVLREIRWRELGGHERRAFFNRVGRPLHLLPETFSLDGPENENVLTGPQRDFLAELRKGIGKVFGFPLADVPLKDLLKEKKGSEPPQRFVPLQQSPVVPLPPARTPKEALIRQNDLPVVVSGPKDPELHAFPPSVGDLTVVVKVNGDRIIVGVLNSSGHLPGEVVYSFSLPRKVQESYKELVDRVKDEQKSGRLRAISFLQRQLVLNIAQTIKRRIDGNIPFNKVGTIRLILPGSLRKSSDPDGTFYNQPASNLPLLPGVNLKGILRALAWRDALASSGKSLLKRARLEVVSQPLAAWNGILATKDHLPTEKPVLLVYWGDEVETGVIVHNRLFEGGETIRHSIGEIGRHMILFPETNRFEWMGAWLGGSNQPHEIDTPFRQNPTLEGTVNITALEKKYRISALENIAAEKERIALAPAGQLGQALGAYLKSIRAQFGEYLFPQEIILTGPVNDLDPKIREGVQRGFEEEMKRPRNEELGYRHGLEKRYGDWAAQVTADPARREELSRLHGAFYVENYLLAQGIAFRKNPAQGLSVHVSAERARRDNAGEVRPVQVVLSYERDGRKENARLILHRPESETLGETAESILRLASERVDLHQRPDAIHSPLSDILRIELDMPLTVQVMKAEATVAEVKKVQDTPPLEAVVSAGTDDDKTPAKTPAVPPSQPSDDGLRRELFTPAQVLEHLRRESQRIPLDNFDHRKYGLPMKGSEFLKIMPYLYQAKVSLKFDPAFSHFSQKSLDDGTKKLRALGEAIGKLADPDEIIILLEQNSLLILLGKFTVSPLIAREIFWKALHFCLSPEFLKESTADVSTGKITRSEASRGARAAISPPAAPARLTRHLTGARLASTHSHAVIFEELQSVLVKSKRFEKIPTARSIQKLHVVSIRDTSGLKEVWFNPGGENGPTIHFFHKNPSEPAKRESVDVSFYGNKSKVSLSLGDGAFDDYLFREKKLQDPVEPKSHLVKAGFIEDAFYLVVTREFFDYYSRDPKVMGKIGSWIVPEDDARAGKVTLSLKAAETPRDILEEEVTPPKITAEKAPRARSRSEKPEIRLDPEQYRKFLEWLTKFDPDKNKRVADFLNQILQMTEPQEVRRGFRRSGFKNTFVPRFIRTLEDEGINVYKLGKPQFETFLAFARFLVKKPEVEKIIRSWKTRAGARLADLGSVASAFKHRHTSNTGAFFLENDAEPVLLTPSETRTNPPTVEFIESLKPRIVSVLEEEKIPKPTDVAERVIRILVHLYDAKKSSGATRGSRAAISPPAAPARLTRHLAGARLTTQPVEPSLGADGAWLAGTGEPKHSGAIYDVIREIAEASHLFDWRFSWADPSVRLLLVFDDASLVSHKSDFSVFIASVIGQTRSFEKSKAVFDILTAFTGKNEHVTLKILEEVAPLIVRAVVEEIINSGGDLVIALIEKGLVASRDDFEEAIRVIQERKETKPDAPEIFLLWEREALRAVLSRKVSVLADLEKVDLPAIGSSETTAAMKEGSPKVFNALVQEARELLEQLKTQSDFRNFSPSVHDSPDQAPLVLRRKIRQFLRELEEMKLNLTVDGKADGEIVVRPDKGSDPREASRNLQSLLVGDMKKRFGLDLDPAENAPDQIFNGSFYTQVTLVCRNPELFEAIQNELSHEWARGQDESLGVESPQPRLPVDLARLVEVQKVRGNQKDPNMTALPPSPAPIPSSQTASRAPSKDRPVPVPTPAEPNTNPPLSMNGRISELVTDFTRHIGGLTFVKGGDVNFHADLLRGIVLDYPDEIQTIVEELVKKVELNLSLVGVRGLESAAVLYLLNYALLQWKENPVKQNEAVGLLSGRRDFFEKINHSYDGSDKTKVHLAVLGLLSHLKVKKSEPSADPKEKRRKALNQLAWKVITSAKDIPQALENFKTVYLQGEPAAIQSAVNELTALLNFDTLSRDDARINLGVLLVLTDLPNAYKTLSVLQKAAGVMAYSRSKGEEFKKPLYGTVRFQAVRFFESITDLTPEMESLKNQVLTLKLKRWPPLAEKSVAPRDSQLEAPPAGARAAISPPAAPTRLTRHLTGARLAEMTPEERTREAIKKSKLALANSPQRDRLAYESFLNAYLEAVKLEALFKSSSNLLFNGSFPFAIVDAIVGPVDLHLQAATNATLNFDTTLGAINNPAVIRHFLAFFSPPVERLAIPYVEKASSRLAQLEKSGARLAVSSADELKRAELHRVLRQLEQHPVLSRQPSVSDVVLAVRTGWANTSVEKASSQLLAVIRTLPEELMIGVGISEILDTLEVLSKPSKPGAEPILVPRTDREVENSLGRELVYFVKRSFPNGISPREIDGLGQSYEIPILIEIQPNGNISNIFEETPAGFVQKPDTVVYRAAYNLETKRIQILPDIHQKSLKIVRYVVYHQLKQVVESYNAKLPRFSVPPAGVKAQPPLEDGPTPEGARLAAEETKTVAARLAAEVRAEKTPATYPVLVQARPVFFVLQAVPAGVGVSAVPVFLPFDGVTSPPIFTGTFSRNQLTEIRANSAQSKFGLRDGSFNAYEMVTGTSAKVWNEIFKALNGEGGAASGSITAFTLPAEILSTERDLAETLKVLDAIARARGNAFKFVLTYRAGETAPDAAALEKLSSQNVMLEAVEIKAGRTVSEAVLDRVPPDRLGQLVMAADLADIEHRPETLGVREASEKLHERVRLVGIERPVGLHSPISISEMVQAGLSALFGIPVSSALGLKEIHTVFGPIYVVTALVDQEIAQVRHARESERSA
jgi:lactate dehydrogenase-like 2-hydroxyacid dehydrogenase/signal transduction histidine kinase